MRGVVSGSAGDTAARMRARPTKIKSRNRGAISRPAGHRAHEKKLFERKIAVKNIPFGQAIGAFQIKRREHLSRDDGIRYVGRILRDFFHYAIAEKLALFVPSAVAQLVRDVLNESSHNVLAWGRESGIHIRRNDTINPQLFRNFAELGDVVATLGEFQRRHQSEK